MLETCPRCSNRLGPPLKSGRQVCAHCGWSSAAIASHNNPSSQEGAGVGSILQVCGRILKRIFQYVGSLFQVWMEKLQKSKQNSNIKPGNMVKGLTDKLSSLEQAIPTEVSDSKRPWMTVEEAFVHLGGDVRLPTSIVHSLDGRSRVPLARFREYYSEQEFKAYGLEMSLERRRAHKPWLRVLPQD
ncbi:hypothetical protein [Acaryochloris sp. CCMEE 5410]|uniref:hypothetical protein n=1 Tax=Acaryochloris sp. CCMEE 5410 TaxID=310037 RepID=UPI0002483EA1|nr:hypothetical protein [Acaryochloris sp. CCMEE 5410]KAI9133923.1 hypothetical protein ON05_011865 [Acaryochloris sp. CCMEE 5410]